MRINILLDAHASTLYGLAGEEYAARNPDAATPPPPSAVFRYLLRAWAAGRRKGVAASVEEPAVAAAPSVEEPAVARVEEPAVARVEEPVVAATAGAAAPRKSSRSPKASATRKASEANGKRSKSSKPGAPPRDPQQTVIPGAEKPPVATSKTRTPAAPLASAEDVARIGRYLSGYPNTPGVLNGGKLAIAAGVPRQRSSLFKVQAAAKAGEKLPGMQAETAVAVLAYLDAQGEVARVSQETTGQ